MAKSKAKTKETDTSTGKPGTTTDLSSSVITVVGGVKNPASKHSDRFRRFAMMKTGMTVGEWYSACRNEESITGRAHSKLALRAEAKFYHSR